MVKKDELEEKKTEKAIPQIEKFIFRGGELVSFQVGGKMYSLNELMQLGNEFLYVDTIDYTTPEGKPDTRTSETKIIVTDIGHGKYLSTKEKGDPIEKTFAKLITA